MEHILKNLKKQVCLFLWDYVWLIIANDEIDSEKQITMKDINRPEHRQRHT